MKIAICQPYFFPYAGYFKLISEVDLFVFFDDVQYIRRGWVNRNKVRSQDPFYITVPIKNCIRSTKINKIEIQKDWVTTHLRTFQHLYGKTVLSHDLYRYYATLNRYDFLCPMLCDSLIWMSKYFGFTTQFEYASNFSSSKSGQDRIIDLCEKLNATTYVNLPGGKLLYDKNNFELCGIELQFIDTSMYQPISMLERCFNGNAGNLRFC